MGNPVFRIRGNILSGVTSCHRSRFSLYRRSTDAVGLRKARRSMNVPIDISFAKHSVFTDLINLSAYAFKLGERGGSRITFTRSRSRKVRNAAVYFVSRSTIKYSLPRSVPDWLSSAPLATCNILHPITMP
jgi:hypothetical protein